MPATSLTSATWRAGSPSPCGRVCQSSACGVMTRCAMVRGGHAAGPRERLPHLAQDLVDERVVLRRGPADRAEQLVDHRVAPLVLVQQQVSQQQEAQVAVGVRAAATEAGLAQDGDDRLVLFVEPAERELLAGHDAP